MESRSRALGIFYGQLVGDALGSRYEFKTSFKTKEMLVTDDSEMAESLLSSLIHNKCYDASHVACCYAWWACGTNPPDIGNATKLALCSFKPSNMSSKWTHDLTREDRAFVRCKVEENVQKYNLGSLSNGTLMRQSVIAAYFGANDNFAVIAAAAESDTRLTHCHPAALSFSLAFLRALFLLIKGVSPTRVLRACIDKCGSQIVREHLETSEQRAVPVSLQEGRTTNGDNKAIGYAGVALQIAFYEMVHATSFESGLIETISFGGDTDTNAAIAGALLGARFGVESIPEHWKAAVRKANMRMKGENGIESFEFLANGVVQQY